MVIGLLLYGRNLPEAGRTLGRVAAQFRRGLHDFKMQMDREGDLQEVKRTFQGTAAELKRVAEVPRAQLDPHRLLSDPAIEADPATATPWHQESPGVPHDPSDEPIVPPGSDWRSQLTEADKLDEDIPDEPEPPPQTTTPPKPDRPD